MRRAALVGLALLAGCGPPDDLPRRAAASRVAAEHPDRAALWPILLAHCLRDPDCRPASDFGEGAHEASGEAGDVVWRLRSPPGEPKELAVSLISARGRGGEAGRPLTLDETPAGLDGRRLRETWLTLRHAPSPEGGWTLAGFSLRTPLLALAAPMPVEADAEAREAATRAHVEAMAQPAGAAGLRVELAAGGETLLAGATVGQPARAHVARDLEALAFSPWRIGMEAALDPAAAARLDAALAVGAPLTLRVSDPAGAVALDAGFSAAGYDEALAAATAALADPALALPLTARCSGLAATPAAATCQLAGPAGGEGDPASPAGSAP